MGEELKDRIEHGIKEKRKGADHIENFTNLLTLLRERKDLMEEERNSERRSPKDQRIHLAMTEGVFERFRSHLDDEKEFIQDIVVLTASQNPRGCKAGKNYLHVWLGEDRKVHIGLQEGLNKKRSNSSRKSCIILCAGRTWHADGTDHDSIGIVIE